MRTKTWKTRDGHKIRVMDMEDGHLMNTILFLERAHEHEAITAADFAATFGGDSMASYYADQEVDNLMASAPGDLYPIYEDMMTEITYRNLSGALEALRSERQK